MITNLREVDPQITPGREIEVVAYNVRNYRLHNSLEQITRLLFFCLECDSNNTNSKSIPTEVSKVLSQWAIAKDEFEFGIANNDLPIATHEYAYKVYLPTGIEIQKVRNVKMKRIVTEIFNTARVMLSVDSAGAQAFIDTATDAEDIRKMFSVTDATLARWVGDGTQGDTGFDAPAYERLGTMLPDVDGDYAQILEPSSDMPAPKLPDVKDLAPKTDRK